MIEIIAIKDVTLHTAGKYCEDDISIKIPEVREPVLQEKTALSNGEFIPDKGYEGLSKVTVKVPGTDTSDATATKNDMLKDKTAYVNGEKVVGGIETFDGSYKCDEESTGGGSIFATLRKKPITTFSTRYVNYINDLITEV